MVKFKEKVRDCCLFVKVKVPYNSAINDNELDFFSRKYLRGFLKPKRIKNNTIEYTGPVSISLYERMKNPISKYDFFFLIEQVIDATQKLQNNSLSWNKVLWDIRRAYINETTKELQLIYLPIETMTSPANVIRFIENIIYSSKPVNGRDSDFISRFVYFIKDLQQYDPEKIEAYIRRVDRDVVNTIKRHSTRISDFITDKPKDYYDHYDKKNLDEEATVLLNEEEAVTGLLNEEDEETTNQLDQNGLYYPTLYRVLTEEKIIINKPVFRLGKERSYVDYFVTNNNAVSRSHADIITRGDRYFVIDLNSKNKTYINGQQLPVQRECEIYDGNRLVLGNEEFIFNTNKK